MTSTPQQRSIQGRMAAHVMHSEHDALKTTAKARAKFLGRFEKQVDPEGVLSPQERAKRARHAKSAYFQRLAMRSAQVRRGETAETTLESSSFLGTNADSTALHGS